MKTKSILMCILIVQSLTLYGQIKIFEDDWISVGSLIKGGKGIQVEPTGAVSFHPNIWGVGIHMQTSYSTDDYVRNWAVVGDYNESDVFWVNGMGDAYSRNILLGSDSTLKTNIEDIPSPLDKLLQLHGVMFNFRNQKPSIDTVKVKDKQGNWHTIPPETYNIDSANFKPGVLERMFKEREMKHLGVLAQEVEKIVPEVVRMQSDGYLSVEYCSLIGLIIEAIKEQQEQINALTIPASQLKTIVNHDSIIKNKENYLYQNSPNPFNERTVIKFKISSSVIEASILIFNMQGTLLKTYKALDSKSELNIYNHEFMPGMYLYSLIADGNEVDTKRMILTE